MKLSAIWFWVKSVTPWLSLIPDPIDTGCELISLGLHSICKMKLSTWWLRQHRIHLQHRRPMFNPWVGKIPWRREWWPTPVFLPGKFYGKRRLTGYSPWGCKESDTTEGQKHKHIQIEPLSWLYYEEWTDDAWRVLEIDSVDVYYNYYPFITEIHTKRIHQVLLDSTAFSVQLGAWSHVIVLISTLSTWL